VKTFIGFLIVLMLSMIATELHEIHKQLIVVASPIPTEVRK